MESFYGGFVSGVIWGASIRRLCRLLSTNEGDFPRFCVTRWARPIVGISNSKLRNGSPHELGEQRHCESHVAM